MIEILRQIASTLFNLKSGGFTSVYKLTGAQVGVDGAAYASGDVLGSGSPIKVELVRGNFGSGIVQSIITQDLSNQSGAYDIVFFDSNPTSTTFTDNAALDIADADLPKVIGVVNVVAGDYAAFNDSAVGTTLSQQIAIKAATNSPHLWIALVSRDTKTYVADELSIAIGVLQD